MGLRLKAIKFHIMNAATITLYLQEVFIPPKKFEQKRKSNHHKSWTLTPSLTHPFTVCPLALSNMKIFQRKTLGITKQNSNNNNNNKSPCVTFEHSYFNFKCLNMFMPTCKQIIEQFMPTCKRIIEQFDRTWEYRKRSNNSTAYLVGKNNQSVNIEQNSYPQIIEKKNQKRKFLWSNRW